MFKPAARLAGWACCSGTARSLSTSPVASSGHSRWSKIRHHKGAMDAQRGIVFTKLMVEVHAALRPPNSADPSVNPKLALALGKAKEGGVPKANIEAAFARARKLADGTGKHVMFEAIAPGGRVAFIVECLTDNSTRTVARVREIFTKFGSNMTPVAYMFERKGVVRVTPSAESGATFDGLFETALEGGAEDVAEVEGEGETVWEVITAPTDLNLLTTLLTSPPHDSLYSLQSSELAYLANEPVPVATAEGEDGITEEQAEKIDRCVDMLEEESDTVKVWTNLE